MRLRRMRDSREALRAFFVRGFDRKPGSPRPQVARYRAGGCHSTLISAKSRVTKALELLDFIKRSSNLRTDAPHQAVELSPREPSMNPTNLPFDSESMLAGLRAWVECESPTFDASAVDRMLDLAAREMAIMGASIERIAGRQGFGGCVRARFPHPKQDEPGILIAGHLDTVHPVGTIEKLKWRREGG